MEFIKRLFGTAEPVAKVDERWVAMDTGKRGGNYSIQYNGTHYATVRGKAKAITLIEALGGINKIGKQ